MKKGTYNVALVGATGVVGREMLSILEQRKFPVKSIRLLASERSAGEKIRFAGKEEPVKVLDEKSFASIDIALFSAGGSLSERFAPIAASQGAVVIDNTSAFRLNPEVPLVVPEVNAEAIADYQARKIIANPNCSTIQLVVALKPIADALGIERVVVSTYQSTSGAGQQAMNELAEQIQAMYNHKDILQNVFPHQIAFNCIPHIDVFLDDGSTKEEAKMVLETRKILGDEDLRITATCVRVPVFYSHSESVNVQTKKAASVADLKKLLAQSPGIIVCDDPAKNLYPMALESTGQDAVFVGRIRRDDSVDKGFNLWVVADNLRKGAALNAVQIAEILIAKHL